MRNPSLTAVAAALCLAFSGSALAGSATTQNLTIFSATKAASASDVLKEHAKSLNLPASVDNLVLVKTQESLLGKHYYYQQMLRGLPVAQAEVVVSIGHNGQLLKIYNESKAVSAVADTDAVNQLNVQARMNSEAVVDQAWRNMKVQHPLVSVPTSTLVWVHNDTGFHLAYQVDIAAQMPTGGFVQYLSAHDGRLLDSRSTSTPRNTKAGERTIAYRSTLLTGQVLDRKTATAAATALVAKQKQSAANVSTLAALAASGINGSGFVFDPDPRTTLNTDSLSDTSPASAFEPAYFNKPMRDITVSNGVYSLSGPFVNLKDIEAPNGAPATTTNGIWTAKRGSNGFDDTNVYFQLDQNQRYIQSLGFTGTKSIINRPIDVDTDGLSGDDNSHYSSGGTTDYLAFGHGCVNDSEDADVILHEYGHAIHHNINTSWSGGDTGAMGEGFGDYWAGSYSYSTPNGKIYHPEWAFSWDGHGTCWNGRVMNRTDAKYNSAKVYGAHQAITEGSVSFQSDELWSAPLFQSLTALMAAGKPRENVDKIILEAHFGLGAGVKMPAMATAIVNTAYSLFPTDPSYGDTFKAKFVAQNILSGTTPPTGTTISETESNNSTATANLISNANTTVNASMAASTDTDFFKVTIPAGATLTATMTPNSTSDYDLALLNSAGTQISTSTKGAGLVDALTNTNTGTTGKVVYVKVFYYSGGTGATSGKYTLNLKW